MTEPSSKTPQGSRVSEQGSPKLTRAQKREIRREEALTVQREELAKLRAEEEQAAVKHRELVKRTMGRPSDYTLEQAQGICAWIAEGRSLKSWCRANGREMVTVYKWLADNKDFAQMYARAHDDRADSLADELQDIADESQFGTLEQIQAARLRIETRKWIAAKLKPRKWGEAPPAEQRSNVVFNIGISRVPHTVGHTIDATPLIPQGDAPGS